MLKSSAETTPGARFAWTPERPGNDGRRVADSSPRSLLHHCRNRQILRTSTKTALFVGTTLAFINHFHGILSLSLTRTEIVQILITFLVPFSVATYSAARQREYLERLSARPMESPEWTGRKVTNTGETKAPGDRASVGNSKA